MEKKKIFITGISGYLGQNLCRHLECTDWCEKFYGMDLRKPLYKFDKGEFRQMDINDPALAAWVAEVKPDIMVHLAYVLQEIHDVGLMHHVNFDGSRNALAAAAAGGVSQILVASSGTAYGAWPDNPVPMKEDHPLRPNPRFHYATDKKRIEELCAEFSQKHPQVVISIIRPCVVYGPLVDNYISDLITGPFVIAPRGYDSLQQFVHEDDVSGAIIKILEKRSPGPINLAPEDTITISQIIEMSKKPKLFLPDWIVDPSVKLQWALRIPWLNLSAAFLDYIRYPWVVDSSRLRNEIGYRFKYSSWETVEILLRAKGILK